MDYQTSYRQKKIFVPANFPKIPLTGPTSTPQPIPSPTPFPSIQWPATLSFKSFRRGWAIQLDFVGVFDRFVVCFYPNSFSPSNLAHFDPNLVVCSSRIRFFCCQLVLTFAGDDRRRRTCQIDERPIRWWWRWGIWWRGWGWGRRAASDEGGQSWGRGWDSLSFVWCSWAFFSIGWEGFCFEFLVNFSSFLL